MDKQKLYSLISQMTVFRRSGENALNKPLLLLLALSKIAERRERWIRFMDIEKNLSGLLEEFGPPRRHPRPEYPFWRLQNDKIWVVDNSKIFESNNAGDVSAKQLRRKNAKAGFSDEIYNLLVNSPSLVNDISEMILQSYFPESIHEDILSAVGLELSIDNKKVGVRDPNFRENILRVYGYKCAVCGFNLRLHNSLVGLDAAHIKWHQAGGPSSVDNGLALCVLHHKLFDRGLFTLNDDNTVLISTFANGNGLENYLLRFSQNTIKSATGQEALLTKEYLFWHRNNIFRAPGF